MSTSGPAIESVTRALAIMVVASLVPSFEASAQTEEPPSREQLDKQSQEKRRLDDWRETMTHTPRPKKGCFEAFYPSVEWHEVPCVTPPDIPLVPRHGPAPFVVGNGNANDISAEAPTAGSFITEATGTFDSVTGVTSVKSKIGNSGSAVANAYTLQMNTNPFASPACAGSPNQKCQGWEQFAFLNDGSASYAFMQYWLLYYNTTCPTGWKEHQFAGSSVIYCWINSKKGKELLNQPITSLGQFTLTGQVNTNGDSVFFSNGSGQISTAPGDDLVNVAAGWRQANFGVYGLGGDSTGGAEATFNNGSTIVPRTKIIYGGSAPPNCVATGYTGETNNLNFGPTPAVVAGGAKPALVTTQSSAGGALSSAYCAAAKTVGEPHLTTFGGVLYDFQAFGDFVLAQTGPEFVVQARQVSAEQTWQNPDVAVNIAVATQMGSNKVAICLAPERLMLDGHTVELKDGKVFSDPDSVDILRKGNVYLIRGKDSGDSVRAEIHDGWINISVGLGRWPVNVRGLLFNTTFEQADQYALETRDGFLLPSPISYHNLFAKYGDSWRVPLKESLLSVCGREMERGKPENLLHAEELPQVEYDHARGVCTAAGVKESLLDACTLDVAVFGDETAAEVFVGAPTPKAVIQLTP